MLNLRTICLIATLALLTLCLTADVRGNIYYLSPSGDDIHGVGTRQRPWRTIRHATSQVPDDGSHMGEDGKPFYEAQEVLIENNLFLHHSAIRCWGTLLLKGGLKNVTFRANTITGHPQIKWSGAFAAICQRIGDNPPMGTLVFCNNIWCDTTNNMPRFSAGKGDIFEPGNEPVLWNNLYFNGGKPIPSTAEDLLTPAHDPKRLLADPKLGELSDRVTLPRWDAAEGQFLSGSKTIREEFVRLVRRHAALGEGSAAIDAADPETASRDDILGNLRGARPDIGCFEQNFIAP